VAEQIINTNILITGAGPAGVTTALFLAKQGIPVTIVDKEQFPRDKICGDALSGKVVEVMRKLNPDYIKELHTHPEMLGSWGVTFVAPSEQALRVPFKNVTDKQNQPAPGYITKRIDFDNYLVEKIRAEKLITFIEKCSIRNYNYEGDRLIAQSQCGKYQFNCKMVIGADGAYSALAKDVAGIKAEAEHNCYGLRAYYKNVQGLDHENFIELHFINDVLPGYFWIFPLPNGQANIGVGMRADKIAQKNIHLKKELEKILEMPTFKARFAGAEQMGDIKQYALPLGSKKRSISGANFMLTGDAASLIDPFTGEGIGNAMMSGMFAAQQAQKCIEANNFSASFIKQYDDMVYKRLWGELLLSYRMQQLVNFPWLFNFVVKKANSNATLRETISCMFEDIDMRSRLKSPSFYFKLLFS
jgi:geranylgeranyl reductase family protein